MDNKIKIFRISILILIIFLFIPIVSGNDNFSNYTRYEHYTINDDDGARPPNSNAFLGQSWTVGNVSTFEPFIIKGISVKMESRIGTATYIWNIYPTNLSYYPDINSPMCDDKHIRIENYTASGWYNHSLSNCNNVTRGGTYAIIMRTTDGDVNNYARWLQDSSSPTYYGGIRIRSDDNGSTFDMQPTADYMFEIYGIPPNDAYPISNLSYPEDNNQTNSNITVFFECNGSDDFELDSVNWYIWNLTGSQVNSSSVDWNGTFNSSIFTHNFTYDGLYIWNCLVYDNATQGDWDINRTLNISSVDLLPPDVNITYPLSQNYIINVSELNYTFGDADYCWYNLGTSNSTPVIPQNFTGLISNEGSNTWVVWCNDSSDNLGNDSVTFFKDTIAPNINLTYPLNQSYAINITRLNYTFDDASHCWYNTGNSTNSTPVNPINFTGLISNEGSNTWIVWCNDSLNNINLSSQIFYKDTINPSGYSGGDMGTSPFNDSGFNIPYVNLTVNASDDGGIKNITLIVENESGSIINETIIDLESLLGYSPTEIFYGIIYYFTYEGWYTWYFKISDMLGNMIITTPAMMLYDITCPNCSVIYYPLNTTYTHNITEFNYSLLEENPDTCWFSTDYGVTNTTISCFQNLTNLTSVEGVNFWWFWVNDTASNEHQCNVTFNIDTTAPNIYVHSPINNGVYNTTEILLNITTSESTIWWSIDNGTTNTTYLTPVLITFIGGDNVLHVWANDSVGNVNLSIIYFNADIFNPLVDLYPINDTGTNSYPHYINITYIVIDDNPYSCWYTYGDNWSSDSFAYQNYTIENLTFTTNGNFTRYLQVPNGTTLINATLTLTGFDADDVSDFENTTDGWTLSGASNLNQSWSSRGNWSVKMSWGVSQEIYKQNINFSEYNYLIYDYNKSANNRWGGWYYYDGTYHYLNASDSDMFTEQDNATRTNVIVDISGVTGVSDLYFRNNIQGASAWHNYTFLDNIRLSSINGTTYPINAYLEIGTPDGIYEWNQTGEFNTTTVVNDIADDINIYLETCTIVNNSCYVPFIFHSDTAGFLRYENMFYANYDFISCNTTSAVQVYDEGDLTLTVCAEDVVNLTGCDSESFYNMFHSYTQTVDDNLTVEGDVSIFNVSINMTQSSDTKAWLVYNGTSYEATDETVIGNVHTFEKYLTIPDGSGNLTGKNATWYWIYDIENYTGNFSTNSETQTVYSLEIDNCTAYGRVILNLTLKDEENVEILDPSINSTIELELAIISTLDEDVKWLYEDTENKTLIVCIPDGVLNFSEYKIEFTIGYNALGYVYEFYYLDNGTLDNTDMFNSYTNHTIDLLDLLATDSTTFLFEFTDADGLHVDDAIVHTFRKYIGEGKFREVERSREDDNGETHIHLVEEDVIYYFMVTQYGNIIYVSSTYNAKCLTTPCRIEFEAESELTQFDTDWDLIENVSYSITPNKNTRFVSLSFDSDEITTMNLTVYEYETNANGYEITMIDSGKLTASSGIIQTSIPQSYGNKVFYYAVYKDNELVKKDSFSFEEEAKEIFGTYGVILTGFLVLALILMSVTEGVPMVVFTILGLALAGIMKLMDMNWLAFSGLVVAGLIIIIKLVNRRQVIRG